MRWPKKKRKFKPRLDKGYSEACAKARIRDGHKCQMPGCKSRYRLECHHILQYSRHPSLRTQVSNLICLCKKHHKMITGKESFYAVLFGEIVRKNANNSGH